MKKPGYTAAEMMAIQTARQFRNGDIAFVGIGLPLIAGMLAKRWHAPELTIIYESGCIGPQKHRVDFNVGDSSAADGAICLTSEWRVFADLQAGFYDVGVLGAAQIDRHGNLNTTAICPEGDWRHPLVRLPGSGGGNDIGSSAGRVVVMLHLERQRFVRQLDYLTTPGFLDGSPGARQRAGLLGGGPAAVVTDRAVFGFHPETRAMVLQYTYPGVSVPEVQNLVQWELLVSPEVRQVEPPGEEELAAVRSCDPARLILDGAAARHRLRGWEEYVELTIRHAGRQG